MTAENNKRAKTPKRDPNVPVLAFKIDDTTYRIKIAGPSDEIRCECNPRHSWTPNSLILVRDDGYSVNEVERNLYDPSTWGWIGRLIATSDLPVTLLTKTDRQCFDGGLRVD